MLLEEFLTITERFTRVSSQDRYSKYDDYGSDYVEDDAPVTQKQLNGLEKTLETVWSLLGIDISFSRHFLDRVNDSRNGKQVTVNELKAVYDELYKKYGKHIQNIGRTTRKEVEKVVRDMHTDINIPVAIRFNRRGDLELQGITLMRKRGFKPKSIDAGTLDINTKGRGV